MNSARPAQSGEGRTTGQGVLSGNREVLRGEGNPENAAAVRQLRPKRAGFGLPCAKCRAYYAAADQSECPICSATERVSPNTISLATGASELATNDCRDDAALEVERERFLREFKSQLFAQDAMRESEPQHVWHPADKAERLLEEDAGPSNRGKS